MITKESMMNNQVFVNTMMNKLAIIPLFFLSMCGTAPITDPPAHAFELEIEESQWDYVYNAIEYIKADQIEKKMTDPIDAINNALDNFWEQKDGSNGSTK